MNMHEIDARYGAQDAHFFTLKGSVIHQAQQLKLPLSDTIRALSLEVESLHHQDGVLSVLCQTPSHHDLGNEGLLMSNLKVLLPHDNAILQTQLLRSYHWLQWDKKTRYCSQCASVLEGQLDVLQKYCQPCQKAYFPSFSPAVMVLITRGEEILLARSKHFSKGLYSALAGFIEPGETAEMAAKREVREEVGIEIGNLSYFSTQSWPFPDSFMIAFRADYVSGEIHVDDVELEDARWFNLKKLPTLPFSASVAHALIESVCTLSA